MLLITWLLLSTIIWLFPFGVWQKLTSQLCYMWCLLICTDFLGVTVDLDTLVVFCTFTGLLCVVSNFCTLSKAMRTRNAVFFCLWSAYTGPSVKLFCSLQDAVPSAISLLFFYHCPWEITLTITPLMKEVGEIKKISLISQQCPFPLSVSQIMVMYFLFFSDLLLRSCSPPCFFFSFLSISFPSSSFPSVSLFHKLVSFPLARILTWEFPISDTPFCPCTLQASTWC